MEQEFIPPNPGAIVQMEVADGISLRIEPLDRIISRVYFVDANGAEVPIPEGFEVFNLTDDTPVRSLRGSNSFVLSCVHSYRLTHNGEIVCELSSQDAWALFATPEREFTSIAPH